MIKQLFSCNTDKEKKSEDERDAETPSAYIYQPHKSHAEDKYGRAAKLNGT